MNHMLQSARTEIFKLTSIRLLWRFSIFAIIFVTFLSGLLAWSYRAGPQDSTSTAAGQPIPESIPVLFTSLVSFGAIFPIMLGVIIGAADFEFHTIRTTFLAQPQRAQVIRGKVLAALGLGLALAAASIAATILVVTLILNHFGTRAALAYPNLEWSMLRAAASWGLCAVLGVGIGLILRRQAVALAAVLVGCQLVEPLLRVSLASSPGRNLTGFFPSAAAEGMTGWSIYQLGLAQRTPELLSPSAATAMLLLYIALALTWGNLRTRRYDVP